MNLDKQPREYLARSGLKATGPRLALLGLFLQTRQALTGPEILAALTRRDRLHKVTVYRLLSLFTQKGILRKLSLAGRAGYYELADVDHGVHPHFQCRRCGAVVCLETMDLGRLLTVMAGRVDHLVQRVEVRFEGICQSCQAVCP